MKQFAALPTECESCHKDPHGGQFAPDKHCRDCHTPAGWGPSQLLFHHAANTRFSLEGRHRNVACLECHKAGQYRATPRQCASCHSDPHQGRLGTSCTACHSVRGFNAGRLRFDHNRQTRFPLTGPHASQPCAACHSDRTFRAAGTQCAACHVDVEKFYSGTLFKGREAGRADGMHAAVRCEDCHRPTDSKADAGLIRPRCVACHNEAYGPYLDEARQRIQNQFQAIPSGALIDPQRRKMAETAQKLAPHNFIYASQILKNLATAQ